MTVSKYDKITLKLCRFTGCPARVQVDRKTRRYVTEHRYCYEHRHLYPWQAQAVGNEELVEFIENQ